MFTVLDATEIWNIDWAKLRVVMACMVFKVCEIELCKMIWKKSFFSYMLSMKYSDIMFISLNQKAHNQQMTVNVKFPMHKRVRASLKLDHV